MGESAAKKGDIISSLDIHLVEIPTPNGIVVVPLPHPFEAKLTKGLSINVKVMGEPAVIRGSSGENDPQHVALGLRFQKEPSNQGRAFFGSSTVRINGMPAIREGDLAFTCNDPVDLPIGKIKIEGEVTVKIG